MRGPATIGLALLLWALAVLPAGASQNQQPVSQQLRDAVTLADACLYLLDSNAGNSPADCQALFNWHAEQWPALQKLIESTTDTQPLSQRDQANRKAYEQTMGQIQQWFARRADSQGG